MLARYRHIVWDWNGTLLDDLDLCIAAMNAMLRRRNLPTMTRARYHEVFGFPVRAYYERLGLDVSGGNFETLSVEFIAAYEEKKLTTALHPGVGEVLNAVQAAGLTQSILSAYQQDTLREIVAHFGLAAHFVRLTGLDNIHAHGKVELGRAWLAELGLPRAEVLLIGDTLHDLEVAHALGIDCLLVAHGHHSAAQLRAQHDRVYDNLTDLLKDLRRKPTETSGSGNPAGSASPRANR